MNFCVAVIKNVRAYRKFDCKSIYIRILISNFSTIAKATKLVDAFNDK